MPQNNKHIVNERRQKVAELYLAGHPQHVIASKVGVTQGQVSFDLKFLSKKWQDQSILDIDAIKARELARIDLTEKEYWNAWESSKEGKSGKKTIKLNGNPKFLDGVLKCIDKRIEIFGLAAPRKLDHTTKGDKIDPFDTVIIIPSNGRENPDAYDSHSG